MKNVFIKFILFAFAISSVHAEINVETKNPSYYKKIVNEALQMAGFKDVKNIILDSPLDPAFITMNGVGRLLNGLDIDVNYDDVSAYKHLQFESNNFKYACIVRITTFSDEKASLLTQNCTAKLIDENLFKGMIVNLK